MNIRYPIYEGVYRILTNLVPRGWLFFCHRIDGQSRQGGNGKYALQRSRRGRFSGCKRQRSLLGLAAGNRTLQKK